MITDIRFSQDSLIRSFNRDPIKTIGDNLVGFLVLCVKRSGSPSEGLSCVLKWGNREGKSRALVWSQCEAYSSLATPAKGSSDEGKLNVSRNSFWIKAGLLSYGNHLVSELPLIGCAFLSGSRERNLLSRLIGNGLRLQGSEDSGLDYITDSDGPLCCGANHRPIGIACLDGEIPAFLSLELVTQAYLTGTASIDIPCNA